MDKARFTGPLFIVGMPRSGTKLLRDLLNRHPNVRIPDVESHFIPFLANRFGNNLNLGDPESRRQFIMEFRKTTFYINNASKGRTLTDEAFLRDCPFESWTTVLRFLLLHFCEPTDHRDIVWGDKTPGYLNHVPRLKSMFPGARFIHIIRDPRDQCLSVHHIWKKSLYRAAQRWRDYISLAAAYPGMLQGDYMELRYEDLLAHPEQSLEAVARFCGLDFHVDMLSLSRPAERHGDARGQTSILRENVNKFNDSLSRRQVRKIESICTGIMEQKGYACVNDVHPRSLGRLEQAWYKASDAWNIGWFHIREKGIVRGLAYYLKQQHNNLPPEEAA